MINIVLDLLFPRQCIFCGTNGRNICAECIKSKFEFYNYQTCHVCKLKTDGYVHEKCKDKTNIDGVIICVHYNNSAKVVIEEMKYKSHFAISEDMGEIMKRVFLSKQIKYEIAMPVPLHWFKKNYRGFNQAELLANKVFGKKKVVDDIKRIRKTKTQVGMTRDERIENLKEVFKLKDSIDFRSVILVDDVMTSGTTLEECAKTLKVGGVRKVYGLVFARD